MCTHVRQVEEGRTLPCADPACSAALGEFYRLSLRVPREIRFSDFRAELPNCAETRVVTFKRSRRAADLSWGWRVV